MGASIVAQTAHDSESSKQVSLKAVISQLVDKTQDDIHMTTQYKQLYKFIIYMLNEREHNYDISIDRSR